MKAKREARNRSLPHSPQKEAGAHTLMWDLQPPGLRHNTFLLLQHLVGGTLFGSPSKRVHLVLQNALVLYTQTTAF